MMEKRQKVAQVWLPILTILGATKLLSAATGVPLRHLMLDPTEVMHAPFYTGIIANLGFLLWAAAASVCLFTSICLSHLVSREWRNFLLISGLLTILLLLDDLLRLHDEIFPVYLGIKGDILGVVYVFLVLVYVLRFRQLIPQKPYGFLAMAFAFFAASAAVDVAIVLKNRFSAQDLLLLEDGAKVLGIANWLAYFTYLSASVVDMANLAIVKPLADGSSPEPMQTTQIHAAPQGTPAGNGHPG